MSYCMAINLAVLIQELQTYAFTIHFEENVHKNQALSLPEYLFTYLEKLVIKPIKSNVSRKSPPVVFLRKDVLKICSKFTGQHSYQSVISIKLPCNFIEIALRHGCSPVNLLHVFRTPFYKNTNGGLLLCLHQIETI